MSGILVHDLSGLQVCRRTGVQKLAHLLLDRSAVPHDSALKIWGLTVIIGADARDRIKIYSVVSMVGGIAKREYVGAIRKRDWTIPAELSSALADGDIKELEEMIGFHKQAELLHQQTAALNLPATLRTAIDYVRSAGTEVEIRLLGHAMDEARRELRKVEIEAKSRQMDGADVGPAADDVVDEALVKAR